MLNQPHAVTDGACRRFRGISRTADAVRPEPSLEWSSGGPAGFPFLPGFQVPEAHHGIRVSIHCKPGFPCCYDRKQAGPEGQLERLHGGKVLIEGPGTAAVTRTRDDPDMTFNDDEGPKTRSYYVSLDRSRAGGDAGPGRWRWRPPRQAPPNQARRLPVTVSLGCRVRVKGLVGHGFTLGYPARVEVA